LTLDRDKAQRYTGAPFALMGCWIFPRMENN
jgi:hypothetical protein